MTFMARFHGTLEAKEKFGLKSSVIDETGQETESIININADSQIAENPPSDQSNSSTEEQYEDESVSEDENELDEDQVQILGGTDKGDIVAFLYFYHSEVNLSMTEIVLQMQRNLSARLTAQYPDKEICWISDGCPHECKSNDFIPGLHTFWKKTIYNGKSQSFEAEIGNLQLF